MAPKIADSSDAYLKQRYDEMYNGSAEFKTRLHNIVTNARVLTLNLDPGQGDAEYNPQTNTITIWRQRADGSGDKTDTQVRDDLLFELHNARKSMNFNAISGTNGYNTVMLVGDAKKSAGYAIAVEWTEWINVVESTVMVYIVNAQSGAALLPSPPPFRSQFDDGPASWRKFENYLKAQVQSCHTANYDQAATGPTWKGYAILRAAFPAGRDTAAVEVSTAEITPLPGGKPYLKIRGNPFTFELVKALNLS